MTAVGVAVLTEDKASFLFCLSFLYLRSGRPRALTAKSKP
jgi:hypothetical protein